MWAALYDPKTDVELVVQQYFHPAYEQCINGTIMKRSEYVDHVIAQKKNMVINHIEYVHHIEKGEELFALYLPKGKTASGSEIEAEVISYFLFQGDQIIKVHGQVRLIKGSYSDADME